MAVRIRTAGIPEPCRPHRWAVVVFRHPAGEAVEEWNLGRAVEEAEALPSTKCCTNARVGVRTAELQPVSGMDGLDVLGPVATTSVR